MNHRVRVLSFVVGNSDTAPWLKLFHLFHELVTAAPKRNKLYSLTVQFRKVLVCGEFGIEDEHGLYPPTHAFPKRKKGQHLVVGLLTKDVGCRVEDKPAVGILCKECECPFHTLSPGSGPVLL